MASPYSLSTCAAMVSLLLLRFHWATLNSAMCWVPWISCGQAHFLTLIWDARVLSLAGASHWVRLHCFSQQHANRLFVPLSRTRHLLMRFPSWNVKFPREVIFHHFSLLAHSWRLVPSTVWTSMTFAR